MAKKFKCVSHIERLQNCNLHNKCKEDLVKPITTTVTETAVVNDRVCNLSKTKSVDPREFMNQYKVTDFTIENLQASGAISNLKEVQLDGYSVNYIDGVTSKLDALDKNISDEN